MVSVKFAPTAAGNYTSNLDVVTAGATIAVPLAATGIIQITISASAAAVTTGTAVKLTWTASPGATCTATICTHSMRRTHDDSADKIAILAGLAPLVVDV